MSFRTDRISLDSLVADPGDVEDGDLWYRSDLNVFRVRRNGVTTSISPGFGTEFQEASSEAQIDSTSTTYVQKLRLTIPAIPAGRYRVAWQLELKTSSAAKSVYARIQVDDDGARIPLEVESRRLRFEAISGFAYFDLTAAAHFVDVDYRAAAGATASVRSARLEFWRVS